MNSTAASVNSEQITTEQLVMAFTLAVSSSTKENLPEWSQALRQDVSWQLDESSSSSKLSSLLSTINDNEKLFICAFLKLCQLFFELGKLPIYTLPQITSISRQNHRPTELNIAIQFNVVFFTPIQAYQTVIDNTLTLCSWLSSNKATQENRVSVYERIQRDILTPLQTLIPGGKTTTAILKVAYHLGIPYMHLGLGVYQLGFGCNAKQLDRGINGACSSLGARLSQNKAVTANLLRLAGLPSPVHHSVRHLKEAELAATKLGYPVVVKPLDQDRGEGVSTQIQNNHQLTKAFHFAMAASTTKQVLVERQVSGVCHRLFMLNGRLLYAVKRYPISLIGDGIHNIQQLFNNALDENDGKAPWFKSELGQIDNHTLQALAEVGMTLQSIPLKGQLAPLKPFETTAWGGIDEDISHTVHPANIQAAKQAAQLFDLAIVGIDMISQDISKPWYENQAVINEVNFSPSLGSAAISKSYLPQFFNQFITANGNIPITQHADEASALAEQASYLKHGVQCYATSAVRTFDANLDVLVMPFTTLKARLRALVCNADVQAIAFWENTQTVKSL